MSISTNNLVNMKVIASLFFFIFGSIDLHAQNAVHDNNILLEYYQNQRYADAYNYLQSVYTQPVSNNKVIGMLAYTAQMSGKLPEAERYYLQILEKDTTNVPVLFSLGNINIRRNNNVNALAYYKKILLKDSTNFNVYRQLSILSKNTGELADAIIYLQKANKINPVDGDVAYDLINFYLPLKQYKQADTVISTALTADTSNMLLIVGKAKVCLQLKRYNETIALCHKPIPKHHGITWG
ncbi:MAG: hypothetical protein EOP46_05225 [Sphingobacteriaceae bacterium]|nr:MAG: hypothetical protein EOP46_05225 [Sphingobacteriaceae bacterium]